MTSRFPVASDRHESVANAVSSAARIADEGPYARPALPPHKAVDAVLIDAIRASVGPFVPAQFRTTSVASVASAAPSTAFVTTFETPVEAPVTELRAEDEAEGLPWIESFLDASAPVPAAFDSVSPAEDATDVVDSVVEDPRVEEASADAAVAEMAQAEGTSEETDSGAQADEWPLAEAGEAIRAIADELPRPTDATTASGEVTPASADASALSRRMWSDDDMMDIMPVRASLPEVESAEQWAARARRESAEGSPEAAARALEAVAARVRSGEIPLATFSAEMGEAAALSAALAALLNLRR